MHIVLVFFESNAYSISIVLKMRIVAMNNVKSWVFSLHNSYFSIVCLIHNCWKIIMTSWSLLTKWSFLVSQWWKKRPNRITLATVISQRVFGDVKDLHKSAFLDWIQTAPLFTRRRDSATSDGPEYHTQRSIIGWNFHGISLKKFKSFVG